MNRFEVSRERAEVVIRRALIDLTGRRITNMEVMHGTILILGFANMLKGNDDTEITEDKICRATYNICTKSGMMTTMESVRKSVRTDLYEFFDTTNFNEFMEKFNQFMKHAKERFSEELFPYFNEVVYHFSVDLIGYATVVFIADSYQFR